MDNIKPSLDSTLLTFLLFQNSSQRENSTPPAITSPMDYYVDNNRRNASYVPTYKLTAGEVAATSLVFGILWLLSVFGNALVCLVIHRSRRTQSTTNYFVVSMACADLLISLGSTPFVLLQVTSGRWMLSSVMCKLVRYVQYLSPGVQIYVLLSICMDRFYTIVYPLSFKVSQEKAKKMIIASWIFDAAFVSPNFFSMAQSGTTIATSSSRAPGKGYSMAWSICWWDFWSLPH